MVPVRPRIDSMNQKLDVWCLLWLSSSLFEIELKFEMLWKLLIIIFKLKSMFNRSYLVHSGADANFTVSPSRPSKLFKIPLLLLFVNLKLTSNIIQKLGSFSSTRPNSRGLSLYGFGTTGTMGELGVDPIDFKSYILVYRPNIDVCHITWAWG